MKIGIFGTGKMGTGLGRNWAEVGHHIMLCSREADRANALAASLGVTAAGGSLAEAARFGEVLVVAVPWQAITSVLDQTGPLTGKIPIDCTNPLRTDAPGLAVGHQSSGAEEIPKLVPGARVVKAFNHVYWDNLDTRKFMAQRPTLFYCGDDEEAKRVTAQLAGDLGFETIGSGPLSLARYLEPLAVLWIQLANDCGMGPDITFALLRAGDG